MPSPFVIASDGKLYDKSSNKYWAKIVSTFSKTINSWNIPARKLIMNKADFDDIVKWNSK